MSGWKVTVPKGAAAAIAKKLAPLAKKAAAVALPKVTALIVDRVTQAADTKFKRMAPAYKQALQDPNAISIENEQVQIRLISPLAQALEHGADAFDMKTKLLAKAKPGKRYVDIPMQHAAGPSTHMQSMPESVANKLRALASKAKAAGLKAGLTVEQASMLTVRTKDKTPGKTFERTFTIGGTQYSTTVQHKRGIHDEMIRTATWGGKKAIAKYQTIRRISDASDPASWWHPGFRPAKLFATVMPTLKDQIQAIIRDSFSDVGLKVKFKK